MKCHIGKKLRVNASLLHGEAQRWKKGQVAPHQDEVLNKLVNRAKTVQRMETVKRNQRAQERDRGKRHAMMLL
ncbi:hypothetical protein V6N11_077088 [Hibiscus sabdariffa]|uniref:Uncharacterized protein n=1 Tax=Hibiscus sabdariffa TaxID=183260 RepID=A0ABR2TC22_9ROSI